MKLIESLVYKPVDLPFGTSGLRALVADMTDLECYINALGFMEFLHQHDVHSGGVIYIAGDLRGTTPRIMRAVAAAIIDAGYRPVNCGNIPTPALAYYASVKNAPCVMITGSHIPADRNGIKFYKRSGEVLKEDEAAIRGAIASARAKLYAMNSDASGFDAHGAKRLLPGLGPVDQEARAVYKKRYLDVFAPATFAGKHIVVYQQSAVARDLLVEIFAALGARVTPIERSDEFVPIDTDKITDEEKARFHSFAAAYPDAFAIISADGDSDRPIVIDEHGEFRWGDLLGCVVAEALHARSAVTVVSANDAVNTSLAAHGIPLVQTKIGSPYVIDAMLSAGKGQRPAVAWELNGGFLLGDDITLNGRPLKALTTRDAMLPIIICLLSAVTERCSVAELFARLPQRFTSADLIDDVPEDQIAVFRTQSSDTSRMQELADQLFQGSNMGAITDINVVDGVRIRFASNDIIHFRPSGNAPQFRVYTNADTQARADELVRLSLGERGYIMRLLQLVA